MGDFKEFAPQVGKIVTISPFHSMHFSSVYGIKDTITVDLPVRTKDYVIPEKKTPNRLIFCSVPDRGLEELAQIYPTIKKEIPDASLTITSDYRLWGVPNAGNERFIQRFLGTDGVRFLGAVSREQMIHEQLVADVQAYPCTYDELFCYSVAECQTAGAYPITTSQGALETTNMGTKVERNKNGWNSIVGEAIISILKDPNLPAMQNELRSRAMERFSLSRILPQWEKVFDND